MKKFTFFLLSSLMIVGTGMAQTSLKQSAPPPGPTKSVVTQSSISSPQAVWQGTPYRPLDLQGLQRNDEGVGLPAAPWRQNSRKIEGYSIPDQPEGRLVVYSRSADILDVTTRESLQRVCGLKGEVVFGNSGEVYVKNFVSSTQNAFKSFVYWVKGQIKGSTITFEVPAQMGESQVGPVYAGLVRLDPVYGNRVYDPSLTSFTMDYDAKTGAITTPAGSELATGEILLGQIDNWDYFIGGGDWNMMFEPFTDEAVPAPEGVTLEDYSLTAEGFAGCQVQVGFSGNDIYVQGIDPNLPEAWVKGTISGDKVIFKNGQYLGVEGDNFGRPFLKYMMGGIFENDKYSLTGNDIVFNYDAATKTLTGGTTFLINSGKGEIKNTQVCINAKIAPFKEVAATPAAPEWIKLYEGGYTQFNYYYDWGYVHFRNKCLDVDGNFILPEKISYAIWTRTNGEERQLTLTKEKYSYRFIEETMDEIPYGYKDSYATGYDIGKDEDGQYSYFYVIGPEAFGVQAIYRGGGEEHRSEISWRNVTGIGREIQPEAATPDYPEVAADNVGSSIVFSYYTGKEDTKMFGEHKAQTYDVAMKVDNPALKGSHIDKITIPLTAVKKLKDVKVWLSSQLRVENNVNVPDLISLDVTPKEDGFFTVDLPKPYVIPEGGVYVGYSFTIDKVDTNTGTPVATFIGECPGAFFLHTSNGFLKWLDLSSMMKLSSMIQIEVSGKDVTGDAVSPKAGEKVYVKAGDPIQTYITYENHGSNGIKSLDVEYTLNGTTTTDHIDLKQPVEAQFGLTYTAKAIIPAVPTSGDYELSVKVTKVNGADNGDLNPVAVTPIVALDDVPKHRTLIEEYTGTWCGYCVRGILAMETLAKLYPDDYVRLSYHNSDPMEITYYFPSNVPGYPDAWVDRIQEVDAYYGYNENYGVTPMGIVDVLYDRAQVFGEAFIDIEPSYNGDDDVINVKTTVTFPYTNDNATYALEYILVEDGMTGEGAKWQQTNYYSDGDMGEMGGFENMDMHIDGMVYNDVVIMKSWDGGEWQSVPEQVAANVPVTHEYTFNLANALNTSDEPIIQDKSKLRVVVLLIDTRDETVCNANQAAVGESTGVVTVGSEFDNISRIEYYDLSGRKVNRAQKGVNIMKITYNNGKTRSMKVIK